MVHFKAGNNKKEETKMKLNKLAIIVMMLGGMSCAAAHATPVDASATLNVGAPLTFTHTLTAIEGLTTGVALDHGIIADGVVSANQEMKMIRLSWDREVNPPSSDVGGNMQGMSALMKGPTHDIPVSIDYDPSQIVHDHIDNTGIDVYPSLKHTTRFNYSVSVHGVDALHPLESGQYKLAILADVVVA
ncbi:hypothetical protein XG19_004188 [Salmonella enterica subsp. enterica serovar Gaminara]|nr:hypothetical protein [Salmonella enterica subsp. enterica serovar Gaminara]ECO0313600.1 hypothetical protein [Salmonella enterica subsp. enterica serovar Schwarzengrund]EDP8790012.1 hypothetical protein [Salmonella enterica subsp. enterica]ECY4705439.1 hypothetical protein [Salmonella enterica subsp. enterica serovar Gaminara]ECY5825966.1 hypothetical protein [Salmonella enterica subsp. enterica serovar Schwarzengrund]